MCYILEAACVVSLEYMVPKLVLSMQIAKIRTLKRSVYLTNSFPDLIENSSQ